MCVVCTPGCLGGSDFKKSFLSYKTPIKPENTRSDNYFYLPSGFINVFVVYAAMSETSVTDKLINN